MSLKCPIVKCIAILEQAFGTENFVSEISLKLNFKIGLLVVSRVFAAASLAAPLESQPSSTKLQQSKSSMIQRNTSLLLAITFTLCRNNHAYSPALISRREQILSTAGGAVAAITAWPLASTAASPSSPTEAIRRSAANIPGYGQTDVFYPLSFDGKWSVKREIVSSETLDPSKLPMMLTYDIRFIRSIEDDAVVADRGYNEVALENALGNEAHSYEWSESNPNDLRLIFANGSRKEIKVTKRATERTEDTVSSSEFQRIILETARGIPIIQAHRILAKWKVVGEGAIEGIEIVNDVGGNLGDPLAATGAPSSPKVISKSRLSLKRIQ